MLQPAGSVTDEQWKRFNVITIPIKISCQTRLSHASRRIRVDEVLFGREVSSIEFAPTQLETSQKLLEVEKWSPEGDDVALRNSTFIRRFEPTGRPPWTTSIYFASMNWHISHEGAF